MFVVFCASGCYHIKSYPITLAGFICTIRSFADLILLHRTIYSTRHASCAIHLVMYTYLPRYSCLFSLYAIPHWLSCIRCVFFLSSRVLTDGFLHPSVNNPCHVVILKSLDFLFFKFEMVMIDNYALLKSAACLL